MFVYVLSCVLGLDCFCFLRVYSCLCFLCLLDVFFPSGGVIVFVVFFSWCYFFVVLLSLLFCLCFVICKFIWLFLFVCCCVGFSVSFVV